MRSGGKRLIDKPQGKNRTARETRTIPVRPVEWVVEPARRADFSGKVRRTGRPLERVAGIEPAITAWEAAVIPFHHTRNCARTTASAETAQGRSQRRSLPRADPGAALAEFHKVPDHAERSACPRWLCPCRSSDERRRSGPGRERRSRRAAPCDAQRVVAANAISGGCPS